MENNTKVLGERHQKIFDKLAQNNMEQKAVIGGNYYNDMLNDAVAAGIATNLYGVPFSNPSDILLDDLPYLYFHFDNGQVYHLNFHLEEKIDEDEKITGTWTVWMDPEPVADVEKDYEERKDVMVKERARAAKETTMRIDYNDVMEADLSDPDKISPFISSMQNLIDGGNAAVYKNGRWSHLQSVNEIDLSDLSTVAIRRSENDELKRLNQADISDQVASVLSGDPIPAAPTTWGPFQFLRRWTHNISTFFGGSGLKEYRDYEKEKSQFELTKYYALTDAKYACKKTKAVTEQQRNRAVELYMQLNYGNLVDRQDFDFINKENPMDSPEAEKYLKDKMLNSPDLDKFVNDPEVQKYLTDDYLNNDFNSDRNNLLISAGDKIATPIVREYKDQALREIANSERAARENIERDRQQAEQKRQQAQREQENKSAERQAQRKQKQDAIREINDKMRRQRTKDADKVCDELDTFLKLDGFDEKSEAFLNTLKNTMTDATAQAWGVKHLVQDAVKSNEKEFLQALYNDFDPQAKDDMTQTLNALANPAKNGFGAINKYGAFMSTEFYGHAAEVQESVMKRYSDETKPTAQTVEKPAEKVADKTVDGPQNNRK